MTIYTTQQKHTPMLVTFCLLVLAILPYGCSMSSSGNGTPSVDHRTNIAHGTSPQDVLIRKIYNGGIYGSFQLGPDLSIYGDGTVIEGTTTSGKFSSTELDTLLDTLVNTSHVFTIPPVTRGSSNDNNFTNLELNFNGSQTTLGEDNGGPTPGQSDQVTQKRVADVFNVIDKAVARIKTHPYQSSRLVLLARQLIPGETTSEQHWPITDFTLARASTVVCGPPPSSDESYSAKCLKYLAPHAAILLTPSQSAILLPLVDTHLQGIFQEQGFSSIVMLRSLLPDEDMTKGVLLSGSFLIGN